MNRSQKNLNTQRITAVTGMLLVLIIVTLAFIGRQNNVATSTGKQFESADQINKITANKNESENELQLNQNSGVTKTTIDNNSAENNLPELPQDEFTDAVKNLYTWDGTRPAKTFQIFDCTDGPSGMFSKPKLILTGYQIQTINMSGLEYQAYKVSNFLTSLGWTQDQCNTADMPGHIYVMNKDGKNALVEEVSGDGDNSWKVKISYEL